MADFTRESIANKIGFFNVPNLLVKLGVKRSSEAESVWSPTSPLDLILGGSIAKSPCSPASSEKSGLGLVNSLTDVCSEAGESGKVLVGLAVRASHARISRSGAEIVQLGMLDSEYVEKETKFNVPSDGLSSAMSLDEIAKSEDYTCIVSRGANPRTTHIFGDCILVTPWEAMEEADVENQDDDPEAFPLNSMLRACCYCAAKLKDGMDIFIYLGEKAFCSAECRDKFIEEEAADEVASSPNAE